MSQINETTKYYLFYKLVPDILDLNLESKSKTSENYKLEVFTPSIFRIIPRGFCNITAIYFWILYLLKILRGRESYSIFLVYQKESNKLIHFTFVLSKSLKFPFMGKYDVNIGPVYTDINFRGRGITRFVVNSILQIYGIKRTYWWITSESNTISQIVAEKLGFTLVGYGKKERRFLMSKYIIEKYIKMTSE